MPIEYCPIHQLFEDWAKKTPNAVAIVDGDSKLTFQELNKSANQLARILRADHGVKRGVIVAVLVKNAASSLVSLLAILKAGGVYLPLDHRYPL